MKLIQTMDETVLNRQQMKVIYGGSEPNSDSSSEFSGSDSCCNNFCESDSDCCEECKHCVDIPNWGGKKSCSRTA